MFVITPVTTEQSSVIAMVNIGLIDLLVLDICNSSLILIHTSFIRLDKPRTYCTSVDKLSIKIDVLKNQQYV